MPHPEKSTNTHLTQKYAEALETNGADRIIFDDQVRGFGLRVYKSGKKVWYFRIFKWGKNHDKSLGLISEQNCSSARKLASTLRGQFDQNQNPIAEQKETAAKLTKNSREPSLTFAYGWSIYVDKHLEGQSARHYQDTVNMAKKHILPNFGNRDPSSIKKREWLAFMEKHRDERPGVARRIASAITNFYKFLDRNSAFTDLLENYPAPPVGGIAPPLQPRTSRIEEIEQVRDYWRAIKTLPNPSHRLIIRFLMLSNKRAGEVRNMRYEDVDFSKLIWTIPSNKSKNRIAQEVALTTTLMNLINESLAGRNHGYIFSTSYGSKPITLGTKLSKKLSEAAKVGHITPHDLRRTMSSHLRDLGVEPEVRKFLRGHKQGDIADVYEQNSMIDRQRKAFLIWEESICIPANSK